MSAETVLPRELEERIDAFLRAGKTGSVQLDVNCGSIESWKLTEVGRLGKRK